MSSKRPRSAEEFAASSYGAAGVREILANNDLDAYADTLIAQGCVATCCPNTTASSHQTMPPCRWDDRDYLVSKATTVPGKAELSASFLAPPLSMKPEHAERLADALERAGGGGDQLSSTALVESAEAKRAAREEAKADKERRAEAQRQERIERLAHEAEREWEEALPLTPEGSLDIEVDPGTMHMYFGHYPGYPDLRRREKVVWLRRDVGGLYGFDGATHPAHYKVRIDRLDDDGLHFAGTTLGPPPTLDLDPVELRHVARLQADKRFLRTIDDMVRFHRSRDGRPLGETAQRLLTSGNGQRGYHHEGGGGGALVVRSASQPQQHRRHSINGMCPPDLAAYPEAAAVWNAAREAKQRCVAADFWVPGYRWRIKFIMRKTGEANKGDIYIWGPHMDPDAARQDQGGGAFTGVIRAYTTLEDVLRHRLEVQQTARPQPRSRFPPTHPHPHPQPHPTRSRRRVRSPAPASPPPRPHPHPHPHPQPYPHPHTTTATPRSPTRATKPPLCSHRRAGRRRSCSSSST